MTCLVLFRNGYFHNVLSTFTNFVHIKVENNNVISTLSNVVHINVEIHNINSTLFDVVNSNVEIHNVVSTLIWRCPRHDVASTKRQRWNNVEMFAGCNLKRLHSGWCFLLIFPKISEQLFYRTPASICFCLYFVIWYLHYKNSLKRVLFRK